MAAHRASSEYTDLDHPGSTTSIVSAQCAGAATGHLNNQLYKLITTREHSGHLTRPTRLEHSPRTDTDQATGRARATDDATPQHVFLLEATAKRFAPWTWAHVHRQGLKSLTFRVDSGFRKFLQENNAIGARCCYLLVRGLFLLVLGSQTRKIGFALIGRRFPKGHLSFMFPPRQHSGASGVCQREVEQVAANAFPSVHSLPVLLGPALFGIYHRDGERLYVRRSSDLNLFRG